MDKNLPDQVTQFSQFNKIDRNFVLTVIQQAVELNKKQRIGSALFDTMVLSRVGQIQKEAITEAVTSLMNINQGFKEEYSATATKADFERVPANIRSRFPEDIKGWAVKDIAIQQRWIMYFDSVAKGGSLLSLVDRIIKTFRSQILQP